MPLALVTLFLLVITLVTMPVKQRPADCEATSETESVLIPNGQVTPFLNKDTVVYVKAFYMDAYPVTNKEFQKFVQNNLKWQKEKVKPIYADEGYLKHVQSSSLTEAQLKSPVTNISWYAAQAYCECNGKRLPTIDEWEMAASSKLEFPASDTLKSTDEVVLKWYSSPTRAVLPPVGSTYKNKLGIYDMHGLIWEWVYDFNSVMMPKDNRSKQELEKFYCGAGAIGAADPSDYPTFLRYGLRNSLKANYTIQNLGFRCVEDVE